MSATGPKRFGRIVCGVTIALGTAIAACNSIAELDLEYSPDPLQTPDGASDGEVGDGGTRKVRDSSFEANPEPVPVPFDATPLGLCEGGITDENALCNHTAGNGCCVHSNALDSQCIQQFEYEKYCLALPQAKAFIACVRSVDDNECCWRTNEAGKHFAVYGKSCGPAPKVCVDDVDCPAGKFCNTGGSNSCHPDIKLGICGDQQNGPGPCQ